jgi:hypothetical protein
MKTVEFVMKTFVNIHAFPSTSQTDAKWKNLWWDRNRYYQLPLPGMAIALLFNLTKIWTIWIKETACVCNDNILGVKTYSKET